MKQCLIVVVFLCLIDRESAELSCVSMKSDGSMDLPVNFSSGDSGVDVM